MSSPDGKLVARVAMSAREQERSRIADGIHNDSLQAVFAVGLGLANLQHQVEGQAAAAELEQLRETVKLASQRLRSLMFELCPPELENQGLGPALRAYLEHAACEGGPQFTVEGQLSATPEPMLCRFLYRTAQELLMNVRKHASASQVSVSLAARGGRHVIRVRDDGVGFDVAAALRPRSGHLGLADLSERLERAGGVLRVESAAGAGATVEFEVPAQSGRPVSGSSSSNAPRPTRPALPPAPRCARSTVSDPYQARSPDRSRPRRTCAVASPAGSPCPART